MSIYAIAVFLHAVGALGLFAALGLEWASLGNLRRASRSAQVREWIRLLTPVRMIGGPSALVLLGTGTYLSTRWGYQPWIADTRAHRGTRRRAHRPPGLGAQEGRARRRCRHLGFASPPHGRPGAAAFDGLRLALALDVVFLMSVKPGGGAALTTLGVALASGLILGLAAWKTTTRSPSPLSAPTASPSWPSHSVARGPRRVAPWRIS